MTTKFVLYFSFFFSNGGARAIELGDLKIVTFRLSPQYWVMRLRGNGGILDFAAFFGFPPFLSYVAKFGDLNVGRFVRWAGINFRLN